MSLVALWICAQCTCSPLEKHSEHQEASESMRQVDVLGCTGNGKVETLDQQNHCCQPRWQTPSSTSAVLSAECHRRGERKCQAGTIGVAMKRTMIFQENQIDTGLSGKLQCDSVLGCLCSLVLMSFSPCSDNRQCYHFVWDLRLCKLTRIRIWICPVSKTSRSIAALPWLTMRSSPLDLELKAASPVPPVTFRTIVEVLDQLHQRPQRPWLQCTVCRLFGKGRATPSKWVSALGSHGASSLALGHGNWKWKIFLMLSWNVKKKCRMSMKVWTWFNCTLNCGGG